MNLTELIKAKGRYKVILLQSASSYLTMYLQDAVKSELKSTQETVHEVKTKQDIKKIRGYMNIEPYMSKKWLVMVDLGILKKSYKDLIDVMRDSTTVVFFCIASNYGVFKSFKEKLSSAKIDFVYDFYITRLSKADFDCLYNLFVPSTNRLTKKMYDFVYKSYRNDVTAVMDLFVALKQGTTILTQKDVAEICGVGGNSIENFVFSLLKDVPDTEKGLKISLRNRIKAGVELAEVYKWGSFRNLLISCVKQFIDLKGLRISGIIYKRVADLPDSFDEKKLSRYQRFLWQLKEIPMTRLLNLFNYLNRRKWSSSMEFVDFIYNYYYDRLQVEVVPMLQERAVQRKKEELEKELKKEQKAKYAEERAEKDRRLALIKKYGIIKAREMLAGGTSND